MSEATPSTRTFDGVQIPVSGTYAIDPTHSDISFQIRHLMVSKVRGHFRKFSGSIVVAENPEESTVTATIDAASLDTGDANRDGHVRSADFLDVEKYPTIEFVSTKIARKGGAEFSVTGDLTVHGVTKPITLEGEFLGVASAPNLGTRMGLNATGEIIRDDFGVSFNAALESGGFMLGKNIKIEIDAEALIQP